MTEDEIIELVIQEVKSLSSFLENDDYTNAMSDAKRETGWSTFTTDFKIHWAKMRLKRHLFFYLATESARKFKVKQFSLDQKFKHYMTLIGAMDKEFKDVQEEHPEEFTNADPSALFGSKIDAGFAYDELGNDITYDTEQQVIITPSD